MVPPGGPVIVTVMELLVNTPLSTEKTGIGAKPLPVPLLLLFAPGVGLSKNPTISGSAGSTPYEMSARENAGKGTNSDLGLPSGSSKARYSPSLANLKLVCNRAKLLVRS